MLIIYQDYVVLVMGDNSGFERYDLSLADLQDMDWKIIYP